MFCFKRILLFYNVFLDENEETAPFLAEANEKSEAMWSLFFALVKLGFVSIIGSGIFSIILSLWLENEYVTEYSYHAYKALYVYTPEMWWKLF